MIQNEYQKCIIINQLFHIKVLVYKAMYKNQKWHCSILGVFSQSRYTFCINTHYNN